MDVLKQQGFEYKIDSVYVLDQPPGAVIEQDPDPGTNVKENRTIYLTVVTQIAPPRGPPRPHALHLPRSGGHISQLSIESW